MVLWTLASSRSSSSRRSSFVSNTTLAVTLVEMHTLLWLVHPTLYPDQFHTVLSKLMGFRGYSGTDYPFIITLDSIVYPEYPSWVCNISLLQHHSSSSTSIASIPRRIAYIQHRLYTQWDTRTPAIAPFPTGHHSTTARCINRQPTINPKQHLAATINFHTSPTSHDHLVVHTTISKLERKTTIIYHQTLRFMAASTGTMLGATGRRKG